MLRVFVLMITWEHQLLPIRKICNPACNQVPESIWVLCIYLNQLLEILSMKKGWTSNAKLFSVNQRYTYLRRITKVKLRLQMKKIGCTSYTFLCWKSNRNVQSQDQCKNSSYLSRDALHLGHQFALKPDDNLWIISNCT